MNIPEEAIAAVADAIEVARYHDGVDAYQIAERALGAAAPLIAEQVLREHLDAVGRCGHRAPLLLLAKDPDTAYCLLPSGHPGWHRDARGVEWYSPPAAGVSE